MNGLCLDRGRKSQMFQETNNRNPAGSNPPASYMSKPLPLGDKIRFSLWGVSPNLSFSQFAVLDIDARSEPFHDVSLFVMKW